MSLFDSKLDKQYKKAVVKALNNNQNLAEINKAIFRYLGMNMPVWMSENVEYYIEKGYYGNPDLYSVIQKITQMSCNGIMQVKKQVGEDVQVLDNHPLYDLFDQPNPLQGGIEFRKNMIEFYLVTGNAYINGLAPNSGINAKRFKELYLLPSQYTEIISGGWRNPVKGYQVNFDKSITLEPKDVMHVKTTNLRANNGEQLYGLSPITAALKTLTTSNDGYATKASMFQNQGIRGFISRGGDDSEDFTEKQAGYLANSLNRKYSGAGNSGKIAAIGGRAIWNAVGLSAVDLQVLESIRADLVTFCRIYGVSPMLFGVEESSTYNNVKEAKKAAYSETVIPMMKMFADEINRWIKGRYEDGVYIDFDFSNVPELQEDIKSQVDALKDAWWITPNRKNEIMNQPIIEDERFNTPWMPQNLKPLDEVANQEEMERIQGRVNELLNGN